MSAKTIIFDATKSHSNEWYGTFVIKNIRYEDDSPVTIQKFLGVRFKSPSASADATLTATLEPFQETRLEAKGEPLDNGAAVRVTAKVHTESPHTFKPTDTLVWGINGNLEAKGEDYLKSFEVWADELPEEAKE